MSNLQEMARLVREELLTLIQPVQLLSVNPNRSTGEVSGRFRSSGMLFDYAIKGGTVRYRPVGSGGRRDSAGDLIAELEASRLALRKAWTQARADGYLELVRFDAKRNCSTGYSCGSTCIAKSKDCRVQGGASAKKLAQMMRGSSGSAPRESKTPTQDQRRIAALNSRRQRLGSQLVSSLKQQRPDGLGNYIEYPDLATKKRIRAVGKRVQEIDRQLNILEGKDSDTKRWIEGDPYGLSEYSDFQSPGRKAYEQEVIAEELRGAARGDQAVFMSGGPASGKTSLLRKQFGEAEGFAVIDPDRIKAYDPVMEIGVAMGMRQAAALAHENSSRLSKEVYAAARDQGLNVLMDGTGAKASKYIDQMQELKGKGYQVTLLAQHVPEEVGIERAVRRAERTGRYVPEEFIRHAYEVIPGNFERIAQVADRATLNDGESNQVIMQYEGGRLVGGDKKRTADYRRRYGKPKA